MDSQVTSPSGSLKFSNSTPTSSFHRDKPSIDSTSSSSSGVSDATSSIGTFSSRSSGLSVDKSWFSSAPVSENSLFGNRDPSKIRYSRIYRKLKRSPKVLYDLFLAQELNSGMYSCILYIIDVIEIVILTPEIFMHKEVVSSSQTSESFEGRPKNAIWCAKFSLDGKYLATGGQDHCIKIWKVLSSPAERILCVEEWSKRMINNVSELNYKQKDQLSFAPIFQNTPFKIFKGHTSDVLSLTFSKNNFLLSSSMDKTVKLWNIERNECLNTFQHNDFVTSIAFHPTDDRFFISGSLDMNLRLWSILDRNIAYSAKIPSLITAVCFTPDGSSVIAGGFDSMCYIFDTVGLKQENKFQVGHVNGERANKTKITGLEVIQEQKDGKHVFYLLVSTNDSRIRYYSIKDKKLTMKFKGHENVSNQISASVSTSGEFIMSGSEDEWTYIWRINHEHDHKLIDKLKRAISSEKHYESFHSHQSVVTASIFAPERTRHLLLLSGDPVYEGYIEEGQKITSLTGLEGEIIITTDQTGLICVFRQDCSRNYRKTKQKTSEASSPNTPVSERGRERSLSSTNSYDGHKLLLHMHMSHLGCQPQSRSSSRGTIRGK